MNPYVDILKSQLKYLKTIFQTRKDVSDDMIFQERLYQYNSPINVISHTINNLNYYSEAKFDLTSEADFIDLFEDINEPICDLILKNYEITIDKFKKMIKDENLNNELLNNKIPYLVMHTIQHIGQGIRLQKMNIKITSKL